MKLRLFLSVICAFFLTPSAYAQEQKLTLETLECVSDSTQNGLRAELYDDFIERQGTRQMSKELENRIMAEIRTCVLQEGITAELGEQFVQGSMGVALLREGEARFETIGFDPSKLGQVIDEQGWVTLSQAAGALNNLTDEEQRELFQIPQGLPIGQMEFLGMIKIQVSAIMLQRIGLGHSAAR